MPAYRFKPLPELGWAIATAVALVLLPALVTLDPEKVTSWQVWAIAIGGSMVRAAAGAGLDYVRRSMADQAAAPSLADEILALSPADREALTEEIERRAQPPTPVSEWH